jgi:hypothetical protein
MVPLKPTNGMDGNKIAPSTYPAEENASDDRPKYQTETRYFKADDPTKSVAKKVVVIDSVGSAANRMEEALLRRIKMVGDIQVPMVTFYCDFDSKYRTIFEVSHRHCDYNIKESSFKNATFPFDPGDVGKPFRETKYGMRLYRSDREEFLEEIIRFHPLSVAFGAWHSSRKNRDGTIIGEEKTHRCARCVVVETIAVWQGDGSYGLCKIDSVVDGGDIHAYPDPKDPTKTIRVKASDVLLGNIVKSPYIGAPGGVSVSEIWESFDLQFQALHNYSTGRWTPDANSVKVFRETAEKDALVREMLAWLSITMHLLRGENYSFRSRCALQRITPNKYVFSRDGAWFTPTIEDAIKEYNRVAALLEKVGRYDRKFSVELELSERVNELAKKQRKAAGNKDKENETGDEVASDAPKPSRRPKKR